MRTARLLAANKRAMQHLTKALRDCPEGAMLRIVRDFVPESSLHEADKKRRTCSAAVRISSAFCRRRPVRRHKLILVVIFPPSARRSQRLPVQGPLRLLAEADRLAMLYNWPEAAPRYAEAESLFAQSGDEKERACRQAGLHMGNSRRRRYPGDQREVTTYLKSALVECGTQL